MGFKVSLLYFAFAPAMMSFYEHYTALSVLTIIGAIYFYLKGKQIYAYLLFIPMIANKPETAFIPVIMLCANIVKEKQIFTNKNIFLVNCAMFGVVIYLLTNAVVFGDPLVNFKYNQYGPGYNDQFTLDNLNPTTEFPAYVNLIRVAISVIVVTTSIILAARKMWFLFFINTGFVIIYAWFSITGFWWMFYVFQRYFSFLYPITLYSFFGPRQPP